MATTTEIKGMDQGLSDLREQWGMGAEKSICIYSNPSLNIDVNKFVNVDEWSGRDTTYEIVSYFTIGEKWLASKDSSEIVDMEDMIDQLAEVLKFRL